MASTQNLQASLNWCGAFVNYQPLNIGGLEPALTNANLVLQTILGPPFCWRWNRATTTFVCVTDGTQDYAKALTDFGFIEKAWLTTADATDLKEIAVQTSLSRTKEKKRPDYICAQGDDNAGNVTFRVQAASDDASTVEVLYQKKPRILTSMASSWAPIPDELAYIYQWGYLALNAIIADDPRFPIFNQRFTSHLLGAQDGLDEMKRQLFLGNWLEIVKSAQRAQTSVNQGAAARQQ